MTTAELPAPNSATSLRSDRLRRLWNEQRKGPLIDVYHGEMRFHMHPQVQQALLDTTGKLLTEEADLLEPDGRPLDKAQPRILRELAADRLYARWRQAGLAVSADDVLVCPYSSLVMLEAVMASVARPDGIILCPEGFYKSNRQHIEKLGLSIRLIPAPLDHDGKIDPWHLRRAIQAHREQLCALLLTMPGNPLIATYTAEELQAIGRVVIEEDIRVIVDATLDAVVTDYMPLAAVTVDCAGVPRSLYDRTVTIAGLSKGHHAVGPYKLGAAITGNADWRADIRCQLAVPLQRETTALARVVLERTPQDFFENNREIMGQAQDQARRLCEKLEGKFGFPAIIPVGSSRQGPFLLIRLADQLVEQAGLEDGWQLTELLLGGVGLETVAGPLMGLLEPIVRINVDAPRIGVKKDPALLGKVFDRLATLVQAILDGKLTYRGILADIGESAQASLSGLEDSPGERNASVKVAVLKEDQPGEHRVALTPRACADLAARGMRVWVESGAGSRAGYNDAAYIRQGATVTAARSELFRDISVLAWVKPPMDLDRVLSRLPRGCTIIGLTHPFHDDMVARVARRQNLRVESVELLAEEIPPAQDALAAMSRFAGRIALTEALDLRDRLGHHGPQRVLIIGAGHAGLQAAQQAGVLGHSVAVASTGQLRRQEVEQWRGAAYYDIAAEAGNTVGQQQTLARVIASYRPEVIVAAAKHRGERSPSLLPAETLDSLPGGTVVTDLNVTRGGSAAGSQADQQRQTDNGVWICNRSNYPSAEPAEASSAYAACLVNILSRM